MCVGIVSTHYGSGRHIYYVGLANASKTLLCTFIGEILTLLGLCFVKTSVTLFLLRIKALRKWLRIALVANIALLALSTIAIVIVLFVRCRPIAGNWDLAVRATATCLPPSSLVNTSYATTGSYHKHSSYYYIITDVAPDVAISIFTDFLCAALPLPIIWDLKMSQRTKISVMVLMCLGVL